MATYGCSDLIPACSGLNQYCSDRLVQNIPCNSCCIGPLQRCNRSLYHCNGPLPKNIRMMQLATVAFQPIVPEIHEVSPGLQDLFHEKQSSYPVCKITKRRFIHVNG